MFIGVNNPRGVSGDVGVTTSVASPPNLVIAVQVLGLLSDDCMALLKNVKSDCIIGCGKHHLNLRVFFLHDLLQLEHCISIRSELIVYEQP